MSNCRAIGNFKTISYGFDISRTNMVDHGVYASNVYIFVAPAMKTIDEYLL